MSPILGVNTENMMEYRKLPHGKYGEKPGLVNKYYDPALAGDAMAVRIFFCSDKTKNKGDDSEGIRKEDVKVGVLYLSDPAEGSGYSYTHDLGILGMQSNLGLSEEQVERKVVNDTDTEGTEAAIEELISDGCNIIFTTSWGYMETTAQMAEKYPDVYFYHGTGYLEGSVGEVMEEIQASIRNIRNIENMTQELEHARTEMIGMIAGLSDIAESNVENTQETNGVIADVSKCFKEVEQSAVNLKGMADQLEQNIQNFKL